VSLPLAVRAAPKGAAWATLPRPWSFGRLGKGGPRLRHLREANPGRGKGLLDALRNEPDVLEAYSMAGEDCLLLKLVADTPMGLHERLKRLRSLGDQVNTRTAIVLQTHFVKPGPSPFPPDLTITRKPRK